jgi:succinate dehydrogenase / fumarate reductase, cytochrome b subunit
MNRLISTLTSSIGRKLMMAITGLCFVLFLAVHLGGNLTLFGGAALFNSYAGHLHSLGILVTFAELGLLFLALLHIITGLSLFIGNLKARPRRYRVKKSAGGRTIGSATMPYTGALILAFVVLHLIQFHFADRTDTTLYRIVSGAFESSFFVITYIFAMVVVAFHVSHGFWSLFQTLGANHPNYMPFIEKLGTAAAVVFGVGFGTIPLFLALFAQGG